MNRNYEENNKPILALLFVITLFALLMFGCKTRVQYVPVETIVTEKQIVKDTIVEFKLDVIRDTIVSNDTISHLDNKYASSWAKWSKGQLSHSLTTKDTPQQVAIKYVYIEKEVVKEVPIEVEVVKYEDKPYTWYEKMLIAWGLLCFGYFAYRLIRFIR